RIGGGHATARRDPWLRLRDPVEDQPGFGIPTGAVPDVATGSQLRRQPCPGVASRLAGHRDGVGAPQLFAGAGVPCGDEAGALHPVAATTVAPVDHPTVRDKGTMRVRPERRDLLLPRDATGSCVE